MAAKKSASKAEFASKREDPEVIAYLQALDHPRKHEIETLRKLILGVNPDVCEGFKWKSASFRKSDTAADYFATINVHGKDRLRLILHTGAKVKEGAKELSIADPEGLLEWLGKDRAMVSLGDASDIAPKAVAIQAIIREWLRAL